MSASNNVYSIFYNSPFNKEVLHRFLVSLKIFVFPTHE